MNKILKLTKLCRYRFIDIVYCAIFAVGIVGEEPSGFVDSGTFKSVLPSSSDASDEIEKIFDDFGFIDVYNKAMGETVSEEARNELFAAARAYHEYIRGLEEYDIQLITAFFSSFDRIIPGDLKYKVIDAYLEYHPKINKEAGSRPVSARMRSFFIYPLAQKLYNMNLLSRIEAMNFKLEDTDLSVAGEKSALIECIKNLLTLKQKYDSLSKSL